MSADIAHRLERTLETHDAEARSRLRRARMVLTLGPLTTVAGVVWALVQPWRLTLLHPGGQGFWWLVAQPPLYVVLVGIVFRFVLAPGIVADLHESKGEREP
jgi:hypothetical protein